MWNGLVLAFGKLNSGFDPEGASGGFFFSALQSKVKIALIAGDCRTNGGGSIFPVVDVSFSRIKDGKRRCAIVG